MGVRCALGGVPVGDPAPQAARVAAIRNVGRPGVVLALEALERGKRVHVQEARLSVPDRPLHPRAWPLGVSS